jgi:rubrerythrin
MSAIVAEKSATLANLIAAFEGESNAHARYTAFAARADEEGWFGAASLFRAVARSEQIHAQNYALTIRQLGGETRCHIHPIVVEETPQNLATALAAEQYEVETMYPAFIIEAGADEVSHFIAEHTFAWALEGEKAHAALLREAVEIVSEGLDAWVSSPRNFYVCPVCGFTSGIKDQEAHCPVCNLPWETLETIR